MSKAWIRAKRYEFARDVLRDFCLAGRELEHRFLEYEASQRLNFEALRLLTGEEMDKGLLWRLKDTAHHLFRNLADTDTTGKFLDWALGYIFHETIKLKEDAYQLSHYAPWFISLDPAAIDAQDRHFRKELLQVLLQTRESIDREMKRIRFIVGLCLEMFPKHYARYRRNPLLARFIFAQNTLVCAVFKDRYEALVTGIYGDAPEDLCILAAGSLRQGGWLEEAMRAVEEALRLNPNSRLAQMEERMVLEQMQNQRRGLPLQGETAPFLPPNLSGEAEQAD